MRSLLTLVLALMIVAPARAGTYEHLTVSPSAPGLDGWSPYVAVPGGFAGTAAAPGALTAHFWGRPLFAPGDRSDWIYTPPEDTTIASWDVERMVSGIGGGHWNTLLTAAVDGRARIVWADVPSKNRPWAFVGAAGLGASQLVAGLHCGGPRSCVPDGTAQLVLRNSRVVLHDPFGPEVADVQGDLTADGPLRGTAALSFTATDRGGGVYRAFAEVDGTAAPPVAIGDDRCRDVVAGGSPYQFAFRRACPLTAGATVAVDTTKLTDGRHTIAVRAEDAGGNSVPVYGPETRTVDNVPDPRPTPTPTPAPTPRPSPRPPSPAPPTVVTAWLQRGHHHALDLTADYGERVLLRGRVASTAGAPVAAAPLAIAERIDLPGRPWRPITGIRALTDGTFTAITTIGPSRAIAISTPRRDGESPAADLATVSGGASAAGLASAAVVTLKVRAPVTARWRGGRLRGRLRGGFVPSGGAFVEIQRRVRGRWRAQRTVRTFSSGRYSVRVPAGRQVRAVVPRQPGLPFVRGVSPPRTAGRTAPRTSR